MTKSNLAVACGILAGFGVLFVVLGFWKSDAAMATAAAGVFASMAAILASRPKSGRCCKRRATVPVEGR